MAELPKEITRWCCSPYKSCGTTDLYLAAVADVDGTVRHLYRRFSNDNAYSPDLPAEELAAWVRETDDWRAQYGVSAGDQVWSDDADDYVDEAGYRPW